MQRIGRFLAVLRSRSLWYALFSLIIVGFFIVTLALHVSDYLTLATTGKETVAKVIEYVPEERPGRIGGTRITHYHRVAFEGYTARINLGQRQPVGQRIKVLYDPGQPDFVRRGRRGMSALGLLWENMGRMLIVVLGLAGALLYNAYRHLRAFRKGRPTVSF